MEENTKVETEEVKDEEKKESKVDKFVRCTKKGAKYLGDKSVEYGKKAWKNREKIGTAIAGVTASILLIKKSTDALGLTSKTSYEKTVNQRRYQYYDPSSRRYFELKREPYADEIEEIEYRRRSGEPLVVILSDMGLLKRRW